MERSNQLKFDDFSVYGAVVIWQRQQEYFSPNQTRVLAAWTTTRLAIRLLVLEAITDPNDETNFELDTVPYLDQEPIQAVNFLVASRMPVLIPYLRAVLDDTKT